MSPKKILGRVSRVVETADKWIGSGVVSGYISETVAPWNTYF